MAKLTVKVNPASENGSNKDEVSIFSSPDAEQYVNRRLYTEPGLFKDGEYTEEELEKIEHGEQLPAEEQEG